MLWDERERIKSEKREQSKSKIKRKEERGRGEEGREVSPTHVHTHTLGRLERQRAPCGIFPCVVGAFAYLRSSGMLGKMRTHGGEQD